MESNVKLKYCRLESRYKIHTCTCVAFFKMPMNTPKVYKFTRSVKVHEQ